MSQPHAGRANRVQLYTPAERARLYQQPLDLDKGLFAGAGTADYDPLELEGQRQGVEAQPLHPHLSLEHFGEPPLHPPPAPLFDERTLDQQHTAERQERHPPPARHLLGRRVRVPHHEHAALSAS